MDQELFLAFAHEHGKNFLRHDSPINDQVLHELQLLLEGCLHDKNVELLALGGADWKRLELFEDVRLREQDVPIGLELEEIVLTQLVVEELLGVHADRRNIENHKNLFRVHQVLSLEAQVVEQLLVIFIQRFLELSHHRRNVVLSVNLVSFLLLLKKQSTCKKVEVRGIYLQLRLI